MNTLRDQSLPFSMISCEASSSILKSLSQHFTPQTNPNHNFLVACRSFISQRDADEFSASLGVSLRRSHRLRFSHDEGKWGRRRMPKACPNSGDKQSSRNSYFSAEETEVWRRKVDCEVEVVSWRERRIRGEINVNADVESVWNVLTDYERLADFIPNLVCSGRIPCPHPGRIWLEQRGLQRALYWHIEARVVLDLQEFPKSPNDCELHFSMVDGDFKKFEGKWSIISGNRPSSAILSYEVNVIPRFNFPAIFLERIIQSDLPVNLRALACRAESNFEGIPKISVAESSAAAVPLQSSSEDSGNGLWNVDQLSNVEFKQSFSNSSFGTVPQPPDANSKWGVFGSVCRLDRPCMVDEIHLRRFDGLMEDGGVHRFVVASVTIKAPVREVWNVLTAYQSLPEIVPNLAISKVLSRDNNKVRILQEGCKGLLYMVLHARVVMDLCERLEQEITFEQVEGDFDSFRGKWQFEQLGNHHTMLKYSVESKMRQDTFLSEAIMEEVIYEDLPSNLSAIRGYIEKRNETGASDTYNEANLEQPSTPSQDDREHNDCSDPATSAPTQSRQRPKVPGLQNDIEVLKLELRTFISEYGQEGFMPMRKQLRLHGRVDIEKAITRMGGFRKIASQMNLSLAYKQRKPKGYWDNLDHLQEEISRFQKSWGMDMSYMPSRKSFERAGRYDIARALEKWGGVHEVSRLLSLKVRHPNRQANLTKDRKNEVYVSSANVEAEDKSATSEPFVSQNTEKWLSKIKQLDINWVE